MRKEKVYIFIIVVFAACHHRPATLFDLLSADRTGVRFENRVTDTDTLSILDYLYYYNGGGVAIADFDRDGLPDIFLVSNLGSCVLYHNSGQLHFEDVTKKAGVEGHGNWKTGVTIADVNNDGWPDIYLSEVGGYKNFHGRNELFINNHDGTFTEKAHEYGLDIEGFNTQAVFFDYDHDGDLDVFIVNHSVHSYDSYSDSSMRRIHNEASGDKLLRNDGIPPDSPRSAVGRHFVEVTQQAGIYSSVIGYGLNVMVGDMNNDGWEDIYVSNDFHENDYYYLNNRNGTFTEINQQAFGHESRFSMGSDIADINNDGWPDLITLDMLPAQEALLKTSSGDDPLSIFNFKHKYGYHYQYSRNCLQLNTGAGRRFSDIALYAGVSATDWSWSPLIADFDNDGRKDIFITNGIQRRPNDLDFIKFLYSGNASTVPDTGRAADPQTIAKMPAGKTTNYIFQATDSLVFTDKTREWGFDHPAFSNGAAYADLDNDGDLDLVVNTVNSPAMIYRNNGTANHYLDIQLIGPPGNPLAIGSKVILKNKDSLQLQHLTPTHGFESSSLQYLHFGLGNRTSADTLQVIWPDGTTQLLTHVKTNQRLTLDYRDAKTGQPSLLPSMPAPAPDRSDTPAPDRPIAPVPLLANITDSINFPYHRIPSGYNDFDRQPLLPHQLSGYGPKLAVADVNGDGLDDIFICGNSRQPGSLFIQLPTGKFQASNQSLFQADAICEDADAIFLDANGDGHPDLVVVSGGNQYLDGSASLTDRLYLNDGKGNFRKGPALPFVPENKSVVVAADIDADGDTDLFIGGSALSDHYGEAPLSYLLLNDGKGNFTRAKESYAPGLSRIGMVTAATFTDIDKDGWPDLVIVGEWMPVTIFKNKQYRLENVTASYGLNNTTGWWTNIRAVDLNGDGREDLLAGNWGENSKLHASPAAPLKLYYGDFDGNGQSDQLLAVWRDGSYYPFLGKDELERHMPSLIRKKYNSYSGFAGQTIDQVFGARLDQTRLLQAETLASAKLINTGQGGYLVSPLPIETQWSPIFTFLPYDFDHDGHTDIITAGNFYGVTPYEGRYDAGYGTLLLAGMAGAGSGGHGAGIAGTGPHPTIDPGCGTEPGMAVDPGAGVFHLASMTRSGLLLEGEIRDSKVLRTIKGPIFVFSRNDSSLVFYRDPSYNSTNKAK